MGWKEREIQIKETGILTSVAIDGNYAITGDGDNGVVKIYQINKGNVWKLLFTKEGTSGVDGSGLGHSVSINGNYAIAGAPAKESYKGEVYFFEKHNGVWKQTHSVKGEENISGTDSYFGGSVSISGNYAIVGAPDYDTEDSNLIGKVYFFEKHNGVWKQTHSHTGENAHDRFGWSVSISGNYAIVGAPFYDTDDDNKNTGKVYFFEKHNGAWKQTHSVLGENAHDYFGRSVSISGNYAIVGADSYDTDDDNKNTGKVYFFEKHNGVWKQTHSVKGENANDYFGESVSISGNYAIAGARNYDTDDDNKNTGKVYFFEKHNGVWKQTHSVLGENAHDYFGNSVSISGNYAITGAIKASEGKNTLRWYTA